ATVLGALEQRADRVTGLARPAHEDVVALLIETGVAEAALVDALCPARDRTSAAERAARQCSLLAGRLFHASCRADAGESARARASLPRALALLRAMDLPPSLDLRVPEGFAFYALYPEGYVEAAR